LRQTAIRIILLLLPLALTPVWTILISDGLLNFGGGEKDLLLLIPWLIWSFIFLVIFITCWIKKLSIKKGLAYSTGGATAIIIIIWLLMFVWTLVF
jgi:hypothetical protein